MADEKKMELSLDQFTKLVEGITPRLPKWRAKPPRPPPEAHDQEDPENFHGKSWLNPEGEKVNLVQSWCGISSGGVSAPEEELTHDEIRLLNQLKRGTTWTGFQGAGNRAGDAAVGLPGDVPCQTPDQRSKLARFDGPGHGGHARADGAC